MTERKGTCDIIYEIFAASVYNDGRYKKQGSFEIKIPKTDITEVFYYVKSELEKRKSISPIELVISISEFFEFNYEYIWKTVLTPQYKQAILEDFYTNEGYKDKMTRGASIKLF